MKMKMRPYQDAAITGAFEAWKEAAAKREREAGAEVAQICGEIGEMVGRDATCK